MHIGKSTTGRKEGECFGLGVETIQTTVLRTNPQNTLIILTELTYSFPTQTIISPFGIIFLEIRIKTRIVIHTAKIRTNPDTTLAILTQ